MSSVKTHLEREINKLKQNILTLSAEVEMNLEDAYQSLMASDVARAEKVIKFDIVIDEHEVDIEEECLKIMALYQPVATDLRMVIGLLKMNNDLERIGDLASNIAEYVIELAKLGPTTVPAKFDLIFKKSQEMVHNSLDALVNIDGILADKVRRDDDIVDQLNVEIIHEIQECIIRTPEKIRPLSYLISISRSIERIADNATNIAEDVIYMAQGHIVRHHRK